MEITIDDVLVHYEVFGEGEPLLVLHGWGGSINSMAPIWQFFKDKFKVFVIDFPGQNNGSGILKKPWGVPEYASLTYEFIKRNNLEKPCVIAHSFGGRVSIFLASNYKDLFHKIVLVDSAGVKPRFSFKRKSRVMMFKCGKLFLKLTSSGDNYSKKLDALRNRFSSSDYACLNNDVMRETFSKVVNLDLTKNLKDIECPTLLIWGKDDVDTPLYMAKIMEKNIPDSGLVVLNNAGHFSYLDATNDFLVIVNQFLTN